MRIITTACLFLALTGCLTINPGRQANQDQAEPFHNALEQLLQSNNSGAMKTFIKENPDSIFINDAKKLLQLHSAADNCRGKLKTCSTQLDSSHQELNKLKEDIDRLTQLNLEMDRSSP